MNDSLFIHEFEMPIGIFLDHEKITDLNFKIKVRADKGYAYRVSISPALLACLKAGTDIQAAIQAAAEQDYKTKLQEGVASCL